MAVHAPFAEELKRLKDRDDGFLTLFGQDSEFDLTLLNVEHGVRGIALLEYLLVLVKFEDRFPLPTFSRKSFGSKMSVGGLLDEVETDSGTPGPSIRTQRLSEIQRHLLRVACLRGGRIVEIQTADAVRLYGAETEWKTAGQPAARQHLSAANRPP